jgi:hypothetical protein
MTIEPSVFHAVRARPVLLGLCFMLVGLNGCAVFMPELTAQGTKARLMKADPPPNCSELGAVQGSGSQENAKIRMRNMAGELGANHLRWDTLTGDGTTITGTAFSCPDASP